MIGKRKHRAGLGRRRHRRRRVHYVTSESTVDHGYDAEDEDMLPSETRTPSPATISDAEQRAPGSAEQHRADMREMAAEWMRENVFQDVRVAEPEVAFRTLYATDRRLPYCACGTHYYNLVDVCNTGLWPTQGTGHMEGAIIHFADLDPMDSSKTLFIRVREVEWPCDVAIWIDVRRALRDGLPFLMRDDGVILSPWVNGNIAATYFALARNMRNGCELEWGNRSGPPTLWAADAAPQSDQRTLALIRE